MILKQLDALREREHAAEVQVNQASCAMSIAQRNLKQVQDEIQALGYYPNYGRPPSESPGARRRA